MSPMPSALLALSAEIEALLVQRNPRQMQHLRAQLEMGYCLRAATLLHESSSVLIGTGFPVAGTFETDGPVGAIALHNALESLGITATLACAAPLADALAVDYPVLELRAFAPEAGRREAENWLSRLRPDAVVSIERPGLAADGRYYNMRGEDISAFAAVFDYYLELASCPSIAIGDGGNEIGMGKLNQAVAELSITGAQTPCDELVVADVSNWGAYGLIALLQVLNEKPLLDGIRHQETLAYLSSKGSVDGVTQENTLTEDGMDELAGEALLQELTKLVSFR
ncbi:MAG: glutamate cyclase domain-containing protein [Pseudomonadota bacterium]